MCPVGMHDDGNNICMGCEMNTYQDQEGQLECRHCPDDTHTEEEGSIFDTECKYSTKSIMHMAMYGTL